MAFFHEKSSDHVDVDFFHQERSELCPGGSIDIDTSRSCGRGRTTLAPESELEASSYVDDDIMTNDKTHSDGKPRTALVDASSELQRIESTMENREGQTMLRHVSDSMWDTHERAQRARTTSLQKKALQRAPVVSDAMCAAAQQIMCEPKTKDTQSSKQLGKPARPATSLPSPPLTPPPPYSPSRSGPLKNEEPGARYSSSTPQKSAASPVRFSSPTPKSELAPTLVESHEDTVESHYPEAKSPSESDGTLKCEPFSMLPLAAVKNSVETFLKMASELPPTLPDYKKSMLETKAQKQLQKIYVREPSTSFDAKCACSPGSPFGRGSASNKGTPQDEFVAECLTVGSKFGVNGGQAAACDVANDTNATKSARCEGLPKEEQLGPFNGDVDDGMGSKADSGIGCAKEQYAENPSGNCRRVGVRQMKQAAAQIPIECDDEIVYLRRELQVGCLSLPLRSPLFL